jgi:cold-inducible RNA-binding protein
MATRLFVGSLSYSVNDDQLKEAFEAFGTVVSAKVIMDRDTGRSKGFGFVEMGSDEEAQAAVKGMDGKDVGGRAVAVSEARPQENRERRSFGGGDRGGRDRGGNRY